jgi:rfaE bifunctional protein kinase chain/domain
MILRLDELEPCCIENKVICFGHFSYLHAGHIRYFNYASKLGRDVSVAITCGPNSSPGSAFDVNDRIKLLTKVCDVRDFILCSNDSLLDLIAKLNNCILVLGRSSLSHSEISETKIQELLDKVGSKLELLEGDEGKSFESFSSSTEEITSKHISEFLFRCNNSSIDFRTFSRLLENPSKPKVLVIGDLIVDDYVGTEPLGISAEAPVIVVREIESRKYVGGAGVVAKHLAALGAQVFLLGVVGDDRESDYVKDNLYSSGVKSHLIEDPSRPTIYKKRYISGFTKLLRVTRVSKSSLSSNVENELVNSLLALAQECDCIVVSDFQYGVINANTISCLQSLSANCGKKLFVDVQCSSQIGRINKFDSCFAIFPTEKEARITTTNSQLDIEHLGEEMLHLCNAHYCVLKLGEEGLILFERTSQKRFQLPALSVNPIDVAGAGDSLLASVVYGFTNGLSFRESVAFGAIVASLNVENLGNEPVPISQLLNRIRSLL